MPSPGYHLGSIQRLGLSDDADGLFGVVEVVQVDADDAVPLLRILISQHGFFVPGRDATRVRCRLSMLGASKCGDTFLFSIVVTAAALFSRTSFSLRTKYLVLFY